MVRHDLAERLQQRVNHARVELSDAEFECLCNYVQLLWKWNQKTNLTSLDNSDAGIDRLVVEPLLAARLLPDQLNKIIDLGSGGGSPAIPMKIVVPRMSLLMVESKQRKAAFLREAVRQLALEHTHVACIRYEALRLQQDMHEAHEVLLLRGLRIQEADLKSIGTFIKPGGRLFLFVGARGLADLPRFQGPLTLHKQYPLLESLQSQLVVLRKSE